MKSRREIVMDRANRLSELIMHVEDYMKAHAPRVKAAVPFVYQNDFVDGRRPVQCALWWTRVEGEFGLGWCEVCGKTVEPLVNASLPVKAAAAARMSALWDHLWTVASETEDAVDNGVEVLEQLHRRMEATADKAVTA